MLNALHAKYKLKLSHPHHLPKRKLPLLPHKSWNIIVIVIFLLDQLTKWLAMKYLTLGMPKAIFPGFDLELRFNHGAAFSFLADQSGWQRWFFVFFAVAVSIMLYIWLRRLSPKRQLEGIGFSLILGGALGNLIDRILFGYVIDFIAIYIRKPDWVWPAFNIADSAICIGVGFVMLSLLRKAENSG